MFYGCGTYETLAAVNLTVLAAGLSWSLYFRESSRRAWGWALALGIVGLAIDACAPGTWSRATYEVGREYTVERNGLGEAFVLSFFFVCRSLVEWTTRPAVFSTLIVAAGIVWPLTEELLPKCAAKRRWLLLLPVFWFGLMVVSLWPLLLMIPHVFPRVVGLTYLLFLLGWLTMLPVYLAFAKKVLRPPPVRFRGIVQWGCLFAIWGAKILFVLCLYKTGNTAQAWSDLRSGSASAYARFHDTLHRKAQEAVASGQQHLVITKQMSQHPRVPTLSIGMEYNARADKWAFNAFAWYHGLESVKVE